MTTPTPTDLERLTDLAQMALEPLDPELSPFIDADTVLGPFVKHPLVFGPLAVPGHLNRALAYKQRRLAEALAENDYATAMWLHERPYRLHKLSEWALGGLVSGEQLRSLLLSAWMDTELPHQFGMMPHVLFKQAGFVTDAPAVWETLPDPLRIYRGDLRRPKQYALSWTLARGCGEWFARRWAGAKTPKLWTGLAAKADVLAYIEGRGEAEIVVHPRNVQGLQPHPMGAAE